MVEFPHDYTVKAFSGCDCAVVNSAQGKHFLLSQPPEAFGGSGDCWSPEELLLAALADCFILSFRAIAERADLAWKKIHCDASGVLDRDASGIAFTAFELDCSLTVESQALESEALACLEKARVRCFVSRALAVEPVVKRRLIFSAEKSPAPPSKSPAV